MSVDPDWKWLVEDIQRQRDELNIALAEERARSSAIQRELEITRRLLNAKQEELARVQNALERQ